MSKNKNYHNYKNYSNSKPTQETEKVEEVVTPEVPTEEPVTTSTQEAPTPTIGIVTNCQRLRVRAAATTESEVLCEILINTEVVIDNQNSTKDFYKVTTPAGVEGFCMKKFIEVK